MATKRKPTIATPQTANTNNKLCAMPRDNVSARGHWMLVDEVRVTLCAQKPGEPSTGMVTLSKRQFDRFVRWYLTGKWNR